MQFPLSETPFLPCLPGGSWFIFQGAMQILCLLGQLPGHAGGKLSSQLQGGLVITSGIYLPHFFLEDLQGRT